MFRLKGSVKKFETILKMEPVTNQQSSSGIVEENVNDFIKIRSLNIKNLKRQCYSSGSRSPSH
ncbi:hypothetical protein D1609_01370 [Leptospira borgpetersenii serovar Hardjo-bovis]|nr:hypothetical protein B9T54_01375 [Leptospira borgpetersenii serovar Hardjo-bovis]AYR07405.1 hypothetical protein D1609_01370 [Leptospira borgpetersenii serovar Hardjo-bovis]TQE55470.1 hypothetical protein FFZ95_00570 [Leptospira borgpetersenii]TQE58011.1 hypothetical protein FFZ96_05120 [Leptospira borgpetersenii]